VLDRLVGGVLAGQSRVLVVRGEAGVGKTALLEYLAGAAAGCRVARASGVESEMELVFAGLHGLCAPMLGRLKHLPAPQRDALGTAFGVSAGPPPDRFLVGLAVLSLLADVADERPLICIVDDAQWLDRVSAQTLTFVARRLLAERVGLVLARRESGDGLEFAGLPELVVDGLDGPNARVLLDSTLPGPLDGRVRKRILAEAHGNPLALQELPRGLAPAAVAGGFGLPGATPLTSRIEQGFVRRLEPFSVDTRRLLLLAAAEPVGDVRLLWRAAVRLGIGPDDATVAQEAGLVEIGARVRFRHPLVRSAAYRAATAPDRRQIHEALAAAQAKFQSAAPESALELLAVAELCPLDELQRARLARLRGQIVFALRRGSDAPPMLLDAARQLEALDPASARETYLEALGAAMYSGRLYAESGVRKAAEAVRAAPAAQQAPRSIDLVLDGMAKRFTEGPAAGAPPLRRALEAFRNEALDGHEEVMRWLLLCPVVQSLTVFELWDDDAFHALATRAERLAREAGALTMLPVTLVYLSGVHLFGGEFAAASALIEEADAIAAATGNAALVYGALLLGAWRGVESEAMELINAGRESATARGEGRVLALAGYATSVLSNGLGRYEAAVEGAQCGGEDDDQGYAASSLTELIEAATRCGRPEDAAAALPRLEERARAAGTDWALGVLARSRALTTEGDGADAFYREAIERLERTRMRVELARARLLYGEWLRRENRRVDARVQLRAAHLRFSSTGAEAFAERARRELLATGESVRRLTSETRDVLTHQETQIARLAADGNTNPEIGAQLFISPRTVEYHLRKVFRKLDVSTRKELRGALADTSGQAVLGAA
jgi:DNA-binding CsgD family transcriptional regulator